jgi:hypothetical protein
MKTILEFSLPDDEDERNYAIAGRDALIALEEIDQWARGLLKHGEPGAEASRLLEHLREHLIPHSLVELLR